MPRLPPILNMIIPDPISSCSEASRGLFVQLRVTSIFTRIAISPSTSSRQFASGCAIRAGRNSPDKEFRYLRTIIVIAGVHPRFSSMLAHIPLTFGHWPGISPYTSACALAETCVFGKQSLAILLLWVIRSTPITEPYPEVTAAVLPSSLTMFLSYTLVYSTYPPVSVCGTGTIRLTLEIFLGSFSYHIGLTFVAPLVDFGA